jgi:hypothetical protein
VSRTTVRELEPARLELGEHVGGDRLVQCVEDVVRHRGPIDLLEELDLEGEADH